MWLFPAQFRPANISLSLKLSTLSLYVRFSMSQWPSRLSRLLLSFLGLALLGSGCVTTQRSMPAIQSTPVTTTTAQDSGTNEREIRTFQAAIHPGIPAYHFQVISTSSTAQTAGSVTIFLGTTSTKPIQTITLEQGRWLADIAPVFFKLQDANFDGYTDIGLPIEGGAKWAAYEYWFFDKTTGTFKRTKLTAELEKIGFNFISFDPEKQQITTDNLSGSGWRTLYQVQNNHVIPIKDEQLDERWTMPTLATPKLNVECQITTKTYTNRKPKTSIQMLNRSCNRSLHTIPFSYPDDFKELFQ